MKKKLEILTLTIPPKGYKRTTAARHLHHSIQRISEDLRGLFLLQVNRNPKPLPAFQIFFCSFQEYTSCNHSCNHMDIWSQIIKLYYNVWHVFTYLFSVIHVNCKYTINQWLTRKQPKHYKYKMSITVVASPFEDRREDGACHSPPAQLYPKGPGSLASHLPSHWLRSCRI